MLSNHFLWNVLCLVDSVWYWPSAKLNTSILQTDRPIGLILFCKKLHTADITYLVKVSDCDSEKMGSIPIIRLAVFGRFGFADTQKTIY